MSDNVLQTIQQLVQDVIAPDVRELKVRVASLEKQVDALEKHMDVRFNTIEKQIDTRFEALQKENEARHKQNEAQFQTLLAAIGESNARSGLETLRAMVALSERVAVLEATRQ